MKNSITFNCFKKGRIYFVNKESINKYSHGKCRAILDLGSFLRAYILCYSKPDREGQIICQTYSIDLDRKNPSKILTINPNPTLELGKLGEFDSDGSMIESVIKINNKIYAYYDGWSRKSGVPYDWSIGLAISKDSGLTFKKNFKGPIISNLLNEPFLFAAPEVFIKNNLWHMWYLGGDKWNHYENTFYSTYTIKHAISFNGIKWQRDGKACINPILKEECQAGATVFEENGIYHMIFCYRSAKRNNQNGKYKLGYAYSIDLKIWNRNDAVFNWNGESLKWDSEMMCYPRILKIENKLYLFYSGNDNGREGFGYAELTIN